MRGYILTDNDKERLIRWLEQDIEDQQTRNLFTQTRKNILQISEDTHLILRVIHKLQSQHRWRGRASPRDELGRAILRAENKLDSLQGRKIT